MKTANILLTLSFLAPVLAFAEGTADGYDFTQEGEFTRFLKDGTPLIDVRLRYEYGNEDGNDKSDAVTIRTRLGYQTPTAYGFQGLVEMEDLRLLTSTDDVNLAGTTGQGGRTNIPDPEDTDIDRAWVSYTYEKNTAKVGRERIIFDDHRFVGNVGWRQYEQTFDTVSFTSKYFENFVFNYAYVWEVNRIFGEEPAGATTHDFKGDIHLINASYKFSPMLTLTAFGYLIEVDSAVTGSPLSGQSRDTFGIRATGAYVIDKENKTKLTYAASYANQTDNSNTSGDVDLDYYAVDGKVHFDSLYFGAGVEVLEGNGSTMFTTPLATVHKFQGFADVFLGASIGGGFSGGVADYYIDAGYTVPVGKGLALKGWYHWFETDTTASSGFDGDYGTEIDLVAIYPINKHFKVIGKYADYDSDGGANNPTVDTKRYTLELNFKY